MKWDTESSLDLAKASAATTEANRAADLKKLAFYVGWPNAMTAITELKNITKGSPGLTAH